MNLKADAITYWYKKGERHAVAKGSDATAYQKLRTAGGGVSSPRRRRGTMARKSCWIWSETLPSSRFA